MKDNKEKWLKLIKEDRECPDGYYVLDEDIVEGYINSIFQQFDYQVCENCIHLSKKFGYSNGHFCHVLNKEITLDFGCKKFEEEQDDIIRN